MNEKKELIIKQNFSIAIKNHKNSNFQIAENLYKKILQINPNHFETIYHLGILLGQKKRFDLAKPLLKKAIQIQPENAMIHNNLGNMQGELGEYSKAIISYEKAIQIQPNYLDAHYNFGLVLQKLGKYQKAISSYEKAIEIQPNYAMAYNNLGILFQDLGEYQKAINFYKIAVKNEPENLFYLYLLCRLDHKILDYNLKKKICKIIEKNSCQKKNIAYGNFLLSRFELKEKKYKNEFSHLVRGHQLYFDSAKKKFKNNLKFWFNILPKNIKLINFNKNIKIDPSEIKPIFIIGVPRSGSTLIEKIIASGIQTIPIGEETGVINTEIENLINRRQLLNLDIKEFKKKILEKYKLKKLVKKKSKYVFTDKSLENFFYIEIIKKIFPLAKIINCRRDPLSSIMSTLKNNLLFLSWPHNLESIFKYYDIYYQIIKNFEKSFPNFIYDLQYEKFVSNPENESKKLMKFCDLPWDKKCLEFYKRKDLISETTSNFQIRKAVYKDSIDKYSIYNKFLSKYGNKYSWFK